MPDKKSKDPFLSATDVFFLAGLGLSTAGIYTLAGAWAAVWAGALLICASYRAPG